MITDGNGNVLAGGERGGKSHITYKPYGEILRTDSYGPDITKFKYTGQEEDQESGLYYYKARYYDASLGRFASNDGMVFPDKEQGMNRMMYVEGNPIAFVDSSGNFPSLSGIIHMFNRIVGHAMGRNFGSNVNGRFSMQSISKKINAIGIRQIVDRLENKELGKHVGSEQTREYLSKNLSSRNIILGIKDMIANSGVCHFSNPICKSVQTKRNCNTNRKDAKDFRKEVGFGGSTVVGSGGGLMSIGLKDGTLLKEVLGPVGILLAVADIYTSLSERQSCPGDDDLVQF